jgi:alpha-ketoglutarate-dependent taurine dioxygenase
MATAFESKPLTPTFGAVVEDFDLGAQSFVRGNELVTQIEKELEKHRFLLFRYNKTKSTFQPQHQVALSAALGEIESTFFKHPASPDPDIFVVSNDERHGCTGVGRTGWHIDGTFLPKPFKVQTMHFPHASKGGSTLFVPLNELLNSQPEDTLSRWRRMWFVPDKAQFAHPLTYPHPRSGIETMMFHCGAPFCRAFIIDLNKSTQEVYEPRNVQAEITEAIESSRLVYAMEWQDGDYGIIDNLALAHFAPEGTQEDQNKVGLRVLHRTTIAGDTMPAREEVVN